jgi:hydrogenase maturation factor
MAEALVRQGIPATQIGQFTAAERRLRTADGRDEPLETVDRDELYRLLD